MYRERPSVLSGAAVWTKTPGTAPGPVLPDGCTDLIWYDGGLLVAGPDTRAHLPPAPERAPAAPVVGLRFAPGQGPAVFGVPAHELRDLRVPLADLWPEGRVRRLSEQLAGTAAPGRALEAAAVARLRTAAAPDPARGLIARAAARGTPVRELADAVGVGERQLHRRCLAAFGYGPKTLGRVLRLVRALDLARSGMPYAQVAAAAGYADQAHLAREVKALAGAPLGVVLASG
ncbi:helix-turn-helix domain-containing protein [Streptomyces purpurogeneiscleroticus]|uniref:helix-turn-helix domain-containing protein n=1 Tax=Streptomyces purpurogeneiscleroticus TaxID=68259 RepID=UPI001CBEC0CA|nr:helix-turn-helix domain-containing protein [Streptomyces purpurogeneiscleroticus]MBZ4020176.1 AraC family transcriptional regulator [Streptomyces purpurogeneiscleroticus]